MQTVTFLHKTILPCALFLLVAFGQSRAADTTYVRYNTTLGSIDVQLLSDEAPNTVANFLTYVNSGAYNGSIFHRSVPGFVIQGGGYNVKVSAKGDSLTAIPTYPPIKNEFNVSNTAGTLAMALTGTNTNSATDEWFFNEVDNSSGLDPEDFTVFGQIANSSSTAVMNALAAIPVPNPSPFGSASVFSEIPLIDYTDSVELQNLVYVNSIVVETTPITTATVTLGNLTATSDGLAHGVTVTTNPPNLAAIITYNNTPTAPSAVGSYAVSASITSPGYTGNTTGTFTIASAATKTTATVTLGNLAATFNGAPQPATATTSPSGLDITYTYNGETTVPTAAGSYTVVGSINDSTYQGSATGTLVIAKATPTVTLGNLTAVYNGSGQAATATTNPPGLAVTLTYNGKATEPLNVGSYKVVATVTDPSANKATATGVMTITKATETVTLNTPSLTGTYTGKELPATATTTPAGLPVTFTYINTSTGKAALPVDAGTYTVTATINSPDATGTTSGTLTIAPAPATVTLTPSSLAVIYTGKAHVATATTVPARLAVSFTYGGGATEPINVGSYPVVATISNPNYTGSANGTLIISPVPPLATTEAATAITATSATLNALIDPKGSVTTVQFQYGLSVAGYGALTGTQTIPAGTANVAAPLPISGLSPQTIYHYRAVAANGDETVNGVDRTFTTLAEPTFNSTASYLAASGAEATQSVNPNGVTTSVYFEYSTSNTFDTGTYLQTATQNIGAGKVPMTVYGLFPDLLSGTPYYYRLVTVSAAGTFYGTVEPFTTLGFDTTVVAYKGEAAAGISGVTFSAFGSPEVNLLDGVAFETTLAGTGVTTANDLAIYVDDSTGTLQIARTGQAAPIATGTTTGTATFASLGNPLYNDSGAVAFGGQLKVVAGEATTATDLGVWSTSTGSLTLVARQGSQAPGYPTGVTFGTFNALGLSDLGTVIVATLNANKAADVGSTTDLGIWEGTTPANLGLELHTGQTVGGKTISALTYLSPQTLVGGQTRDFAAGTRDLVLGATFTDKTTGIVEVTSGTATLPAIKGDTAPGITGATFSAFGSPIINTNAHIAFEATVAGPVTTASNAGIWAEDNTGTLQLVAQTGVIPAPGTTATFVTLSDPVYNDNEKVAFGGTLKVAAGQATKTTASGIWSNSTGTLTLVAQQGNQAAGCPAGATFATFTALALADQAGTSGTGGLSFLGTLNASSTAGVTAANNTGIWAIDTTGTLQLIVRTGDILPVNGVNKTVTALTFLPTAAVTEGQSRNFSPQNGDLAYLATFSDKTTAIFNVVFPTGS